jgi:hypothetical protein
MFIQSRKCEECGNLYHPTGTRQQFCVRPFCVELRGGWMFVKMHIVEIYSEVDEWPDLGKTSK